MWTSCDGKNKKLFADHVLLCCGKLKFYNYSYYLITKKKKILFCCNFFFFNKLKFMKYIPQVVPYKLSFILFLLYGKAYL